MKNLEKTSSLHRNRNQKLFSASSCGGSSAVPTENSGFLSGSPSKKKERKKEKERQNEQNVEFETHSVSGVSSSETGPDGQRLGGVAGERRKGKGEEEKWMSESFLLFFC